jgi:hypothetical protein
MSRTSPLRLLPTVAFASGLVFAASIPADEDCNQTVVFHAPGASQGPGTLDCYTSCPGTLAENNNHGGVTTGFFIDDKGRQHGFVRARNGSISDFHAPQAGNAAGQGTMGASINAHGDIAGTYIDAQGLQHGFVRHPDGRFTVIDIAPLGSSTLYGTGAEVINEAGTVGGNFLDSNGKSHGFLRTSDGIVTPFEAPGAAKGTIGTVVAGPSGSSLNNHGVVTGWYFDEHNVIHGYVRTADGTIDTIDALPGITAAFSGTYSAGINDDGTITGAVLDNGAVAHGFVRDRDGNLTVFDDPGANCRPDCNPYAGTWPVAINAHGTIIGYTVDNGNVSHGHVRGRDGSIRDFDVAGAGSQNGAGTTPFEINDAGEIVGWITDGKNVNHGFVRGAQNH